MLPVSTGHRYLLLVYLQDWYACHFSCLKLFCAKISIYLLLVTTASKEAAQLAVDDYHCFLYYGPKVRRRAGEGLSLCALETRHKYEWDLVVLGSWRLRRDYRKGLFFSVCRLVFWSNPAGRGGPKAWD